MAINCNQITDYANQFLPQFQFADTERTFPVQAESWLEHCAEGDWSSPADPHRGTAAVVARIPLSLAALAAEVGCHGAAGTPIDPTQPLPSNPGPDYESFLDFGGWSGLQEPGSTDFSAGDDDYIQRYFAPYSQLFGADQGLTPPPTRTKPQLPKTLAVYCEAAWAGQFTRLDIQNGTGDFAPPITNNPANLTPDPALDPFFVLTYYLFYPCSEPPPNTGAMSAASPNRLFREGQWEAVSLYFKSTGGPVASASDLQLAADPSQVTPDHAVLSGGIVHSGDGRSGGLGASYPATAGPWPLGGHYPIYVGGGGGYFPGGANRVYVTSGTHKNLFEPTPTKTTTTPDPGWAATGGGFEGVGGVVIGAGLGTTPIGWPLLIVGLLIVAAGVLMQALGTDKSTTDQPDSSGDIASSNGPGAGRAPETAGSTFVPANLVVLSTLPDTEACPPPAWWSYPGRWGIAVSSDMASWDSGGRRIDFKGRSRAYWNTVWLQTALQPT
jgi:hypothetical protein